MPAPPQGSDPGTERRAAKRYRVALSCIYRTDRLLNNAGHVIDMSSQALRITTNEMAVRVGERITVSIAWPERRGGTAPVTLFVRGMVLRTTASDAVVGIDNYRFWAPGAPG